MVYTKKMKMTVRKRELSESGNCFVPGSPQDRVAMVWPLTAEAVSLSKRYDAEQRLQRHIVRLIRRKGAEMLEEGENSQ
jgi:hypothetical protein